MKKKKKITKKLSGQGVGGEIVPLDYPSTSISTALSIFQQSFSSSASQQNNLFPKPICETS